MKKRVRAIIIKQGRVLLIKRIFKDKEYWVFPGGGVENNESIEEALRRECKEELGIDIKIKKIFAKQKSDKKETLGDMECFYEADMIGSVLGVATGPEYGKSGKYKGKYEITWESIGELKNIDLRPNIIRDMICKKFFLNKRVGR